MEVYEVRFGIETKNVAGGYAEWSEIVLHWVQLTYSFFLNRLSWGPHLLKDVWLSKLSHPTTASVAGT